MNTKYTYEALGNNGLIIKSEDGLFTSPVITRGQAYLFNQMNGLAIEQPCITLEEHQSLFTGLCMTHGNIEFMRDSEPEPEPIKQEFDKEEILIFNKSLHSIYLKLLDEDDKFYQDTLSFSCYSSVFLKFSAKYNSFCFDYLDIESKKIKCKQTRADLLDSPLLSVRESIEGSHL